MEEFDKSNNKDTKNGDYLREFDIYSSIHN